MLSQQTMGNQNITKPGQQDTEDPDDRLAEVQGLYDPEDTPEEDLWFLPENPEGTAAEDMPLPRADRRLLIDPSDWQQAEGKSGKTLADAAAAYARIDEHIALSPSNQSAVGLVHRLAILEAAEMSWANGPRLSADQLALYDVLRITGAEEIAIDLAKAHWALRRLAGGPSPEIDLEAFLGRQVQQEDGLGALAQRPVGLEFDLLLEQWHALQSQMSDAHVITRSAFAYHSWRVLGLSSAEDLLEPAVLSARLLNRKGSAMSFMPLALGGPGLLRASGPADIKLALWYKGVTGACHRAILELRRLRDWETNAKQSISGRSGKTPTRLINALRDTPALSVEMAAKLTGTSRAAALRNLTWFDQNGLVREITGQSRYRFWKAAL